MMSRRAGLLLSLILVVLVTGSAAAAPIGEIPFRIREHRVEMKVSVNGSRPLNLVLDTGVRFPGVYLFRESDAEEVGRLGVIPICGDLISTDDYAWHDPDKLAPTLIRLAPVAEPVI